MNDHPSLSPIIPQPLFPGELAQTIGAAANAAAARHRFVDYHQRRSTQTLRRQAADLLLFTEFLETTGMEPGDFFEDPDAWKPITWGLVEAFVKWQLKNGYAVASANVRLSTIKAYARLAMQAGCLSPQEYALIRSIQSYAQREQRRIDEKRPITRIGNKKALPIILTDEQAKTLKQQPNTTPQGRRDTLIMCLLLDHGLRVGELAGLTVDALDLNSSMMHFYRSKVGKTQIHRLTADTLAACLAYQQSGDMPPTGSLLRQSRKDNSLRAVGLSDRAITQRVRTLGKAIGIPNLSAHDCRHYWATAAARHGTDPFTLQEAGGWSSLAMPRRYIENNEISNDGVKLA